MAFWTLYNFGFECVVIGWKARPQIREKVARESAPPTAIFVIYREFATERFVRSTRTQKIFDRTFKELSNDIK